MARAKKNDWRLIERGERKLPVQIDPEERDALGHRLAKLIQNFRALDSERADVARKWRVKLKEAKEEIDEAAEAVERGVEQKRFVVEVRAVFATRTIDTVRVEDGEVLESRPMTAEEEVTYLQQDLGEAPPATEREPQAEGYMRLTLRRDEPRIIDVTPEPAEPESEGREEPPEDEGENDALGLPACWPKRWRGKSWKVGEHVLTDSDVLEVYLRVPEAGLAVDALCEQMSWLNREQVTRALSLLAKQGLATKAEGGLWTTAAAEEEAEPGRSDNLPEAAVAPKPKRRRAKDTGEALINGALEQSEAHEAVA